MIKYFIKEVILALLFVFITTALEAQSKVKIEKVKDIIIYKDTAFHAAFPSIIRDENNEFLLAFRRAPDRKIFGEDDTNHVDPNSYLVSMRSKDGLNWSSGPELLYAHAFGGSQDPCLIKLKDGTILCSSYGWAYVRPDGIPNLAQPYMESAKGFIFLGGYLVRSSDNGNTWSGPNYPPSVPIETRLNAMGQPLPAYNRGAMYEGKDGRLFWVVAIKTNEIGRLSNHLLISNDKGLSWEYSCEVAADKDITFNEASIYETPKGDLVVFMRTANNNDMSCIARSTDGGKSFGPWKEMGFQGHPFHALRLPNQQVMITYGYRHKPYGIRARILNPECTDFATADEIILREDGGSTDIGYPWSVNIDKNHVLSVYYYTLDDGTRHIAGTLLELKH